MGVTWDSLTHTAEKLIITAPRVVFQIARFGGGHMGREVRMRLYFLTIMGDLSKSVQIR
ncbi:hypothetical protein JCM12296A_19490 [Desulfosarcina cetonica]